MPKQNTQIYLTPVLCFCDCGPIYQMEMKLSSEKFLINHEKFSDPFTAISRKYTPICLPRAVQSLPSTAKPNYTDK